MQQSIACPVPKMNAAMIQPKTTNANDWPDDARHITSLPFRELSIQCADGHCVFWDSNDPETSGDAVKAKVEDAAKHPGPYTATLAKYGRRGNPRITTVRIDALLGDRKDLAERLICADFPAEAALQITGTPYWWIYKRKLKIEEEDEAAEMAKNIVEMKSGDAGASAQEEKDCAANGKGVCTQA